MGGGDQTPSKVASDSKSVFKLRVLTHNVRYAATDLFEHEHPWEDRLPTIKRQLFHYSAVPFNPPSTILCFQEVLQSQLLDLQDVLGDAWTHVGVGRDDGMSAGEYNPIFYRTTFWEQLHFETIWLSETPQKASRGWDGGCNRICGCLVLRSKHETKRIMIINTHLDNASHTARREGAKLIIKYAKKWRKEFRPHHFYLTGDLNSEKSEKDGAWAVLNTEGSGFIDVNRLLDKESSNSMDEVRRYGDNHTFTGFDGDGDGDGVAILDFVHCGLGSSETKEIASKELHSLSVLPNIFEDGIRCSDHRAVVADFVL